MRFSGAFRLLTSYIIYIMKSKISKKPIIGVFDSGIGGITVLKSLIAALPDCDYVYVADEKYCPYGIRGDDFIIQRVEKISAFLNNFNPTLVIVACNTASRFVETAQSELRCRVIDAIFPTVSYLKNVLKSKKVLLLATESTVSGGLYQKLLGSCGIECFPIACNEFVGFVENGLVYEKSFRDVVSKKLRSVEYKSCDTLLYGCTHFGFADKVFKSLFSGIKNFVECGPPIADEATKILKVKINSEKTAFFKPSVKIHTNGDKKELFEKLKFYNVDFCKPIFADLE